MGCDWEGKFGSLQEHLTLECMHNSNKCEFCKKSFRCNDLDLHKKECPMIPRECPLSIFGCQSTKMSPQELSEHLNICNYSHLNLIVTKITTLEETIEKQKIQDKLPDFTSKAAGRADPDGYDPGYSSMSKTLVDSSLKFTKRQLDLVEMDGPGPAILTKSGAEDSQTIMRFGGSSIPTQFIERKIIEEELAKAKGEIKLSLFKELKEKDEEIASLKSTVTKLEKTVRSKTADIEDRDFRLSLIENSNHDGTMVWKIPQFSQRMDDAKSGKYTSIFSLPFYTGRYGYKMCLRLYILGDGIGKGSYMSLFFVLMKGEFDNILQWPFTHKVTFKLINQSGGRDVVDTFQPDPMSSSFRKPKSDMNIASGCPRFVTHANLKNGGFIADDTIFIKAIIDTNTIRHP